jgi:hypothetical protein
MWSTRNGIRASLSAHPMHCTSTKSLPTSTAEENPERKFSSTYRCMAACADRKSYPVRVIFMPSMIDLRRLRKIRGRQPIREIAVGMAANFWKLLIFS